VGVGGAGGAHKAASQEVAIVIVDTAGTLDPLARRDVPRGAAFDAPIVERQRRSGAHGDLVLVVGNAGCGVGRQVDVVPAHRETATDIIVGAEPSASNPGGADVDLSLRPECQSLIG